VGVDEAAIPRTQIRDAAKDEKLKQHNSMYDCPSQTKGSIK